MSVGESQIELCVECTLIWQVSHPLCLQMCCSGLSAANAAAFQTTVAVFGGVERAYW